MREDLQSFNSKCEKKGHQVLSQNRRERNGKEACAAWNDVRASQSGPARSGKRTAAHDIQAHQHRTGSNEEAEAGNKKLQETVERKSREELTEDDVSKNLKWMAVGRKGEKRIVKVQVREDTWGEGTSSRQTGGGGEDEEGVERAGEGKIMRRRSWTETTPGPRREGEGGAAEG
jgi:hypothetical protein